MRTDVRPQEVEALAARLSRMTLAEQAEAVGMPAPTSSDEQRAVQREVARRLAAAAREQQPDPDCQAWCRAQRERLAMPARGATLWQLLDDICDVAEADPDTTVRELCERVEMLHPVRNKLWGSPTGG